MRYVSRKGLWVPQDPLVARRDHRHFSMMIQSGRFGGGGGGGPSLPVAGATLWVRSDLGVYEDAVGTDPAEAGDKIKRWVDQSGSGNDITDPGSTLQPTWDDGNQYLSRNTVRFTAAGMQFMNIPNAMFSGLTSGEIFTSKKMVADPAAASGSAGLWTLNAGSSFHTHHPWTDGVIYDNTFTSVRKTVGNEVPALTNWHVYSVRSDASDWEAYIDNVSVFATATNTVEFPGGANLAYLGMAWAGGHKMDGWYSEIVFFPFTLDSTERAAMYDYMANG